jgi:two-component system phosphate regulon sensor histidine kinase PhoR
MLFGVPIMSIISDEKTDHTNMANRSDMFSLFGRMMDDAFLQIDHQSVIINANHGAVRLLGEHLMGVSLTQRLIYSELMEDLERCVASNEIIEFAAIPSNNEYHHIQGKIMPFGNESLLVLLMDMTLQHNLEKMRRDFIANVSHELRSPLTSLIGFVETLQNTPDIPKKTSVSFLKIMEEESKRMSRLIDDLMSLSKVEVDEHIVPTGKVFIKTVLNSAIASLNDRAQRTGHKIEFLDERKNITEKLIIRGEVDEIAEVFHNLIDNALKYSRPKSTITVKLRDTEAGKITIDICNLGDGVEARHIPRLTERFYRVDKGRSRLKGGTGLGLAIVKHITNKHRGQLIIESNPKKETVFRIIMPFYDTALPSLMKINEHGRP